MPIERLSGGRLEGDVEGQSSLIGKSLEQRGDPADANPYDGIDPGKIDLWADDHYHASTAGYYLEALTVFARVTARDPRTLGSEESAARELGLAPTLAARLQRVAYQVALTGRCAASEPGLEPATKRR